MQGKNSNRNPNRYDLPDFPDRGLRNLSIIPDMTVDRNLRYDGMTKTGQSGATLPTTGGERYQVGFGDSTTL